jgi:hypothetical protein
VLPIGADCEPRPHGAVLERHCDARGIGRDRESRRGKPQDLQLRRAGVERSDQVAVLNIVAEGVEADVRRGEGDFRRAQKPPAVVYNADRHKRRGMRQARLPHP